MGKRITTTTQDWLRGITLPVYPPNASGRHTYSVISHGEIMDITEGVLKQFNLVIDKELFKAPINGQIAQGVYHISGGTDDELGLMFAWVNSYDKSTKFKCCVGGVVNASGGYCISGDQGTYIRKHTGNAKQECFNQINDQITNAGSYYMKLIKDKAEMKMVIIPEKMRAELLGRLLFQDKIITLEQASVVRAQIMKPELDYGADKDSLWTLYGHIGSALRRSHPRGWLETQRALHVYLSLEFGIGIPAGDPNQTDLITQIAEIEATSTPPVEEQGPEEPKISFEL